MDWSNALHNGSPELILAVQSGIDRHPYSNPHDGAELASDLPGESIGRPEFEPLLRKHRS